ncbi:MAG: response regulator [Kyrpidia sp.]|nr:response regulator [Kyrpidia sp.]
MPSRRILVVDDQFGIRALLKELLEQDGYTIYQAANGPGAIQVVQDQRPDLIILDMKIPGMDGLEILRHIRAIDRDVKVIMMTAYGELDLLREADELGVMAHFTKPFDIEVLRQVIRDYLG